MTPRSRETSKAPDRPGLGLRLGHVELFSQDTRRARDFYRDVLGAEVVTEQPGGFRWLELGGVEILLRPGAPSASAMRYRDADQGLVLYCDDVPAVLQVLEDRGLAVSGDDDGCPTFADPDGHWFQLVDPEEMG